MLVRELIAKLAEMDPEAEVHYPDRDGFLNWSHEIHEVYESTATYGIALPNGPRTVKTVVLATGWEDL